MKKNFFILLTALLLNNTVGLAQDSWKLAKDTLILANGAKFIVHDKIKLGYVDIPAKLTPLRHFKLTPYKHLLNFEHFGPKNF